MRFQRFASKLALSFTFQRKGENSDEKDLQLEKAIEVLKGEISKKDTLFIFE